MNNFRRSVEEIVQVVKIADSTLRKRVEEFRRTGSAELSVADFRSVWLEEEMDPPAYIKGREKEAAGVEAATARENGEVASKEKGKTKVRGKGRKRKRKRGEESEGEEPAVDGSSEAAELPAPIPVDPALFNEGILVGTLVPSAANSDMAQTEGSAPTRPPPLFFPDTDDQQVTNEMDPNIDPSLFGSTLIPPPLTPPAEDEELPINGSTHAVIGADLPQNNTQSSRTTMEETIRLETAAVAAPVQSVPEPSSSTFPPASPTQVTPSLPSTSDADADAEPSSSTPPSKLVVVVDSEIDNLLTDEVSSFLTTAQGLSLSSALDHADSVRQSQFVGLTDDELQGLDEDELDAFILTEDEVKIKERVWVELNKDYLEALAGKDVHFGRRTASQSNALWAMIILVVC